MKEVRFWIWTIGIGLLLSQSALASHIYGGNLSMTQLEKKSGTFRITMSLFVDATNTQSVEDQYLRGAYFSLFIFDKKTNRRMDEVVVMAGPANELIYDNTSCAAKYGFKTRVYTYSSDLPFDLKKYTDTEGYYIAWERCCRPGQITNLSNPANAGLALYLEFPALLQNQEPVTFSSPKFRIPDGNYACVNKLFRFNFSASDEDGDVLNYKLVTPWKGHNDEINFDADPQAAPYPVAAWANGFSTDKIIPGNPALTIDPSSGVASVKATMVGIFAVTIQCEKIRNGKTISISRQDFQIPVIDCIVETPPVAKIESQGIQISQLSICGNQSITLSVQEDGPFHYQWKYNDLNITGAKSKSITVTDTGRYTVLKSYSNRCAGDTLSQAVRVSFPSIKFENENKRICSIDSFKLQIASLPSYQIEWLQGSQVVGNGSTFEGKGIGTYQVVAVSNLPTCPRLKDSITIEELPPPILPNNYVTSYLICPGDSVKIGVVANMDYSYTWDQINSTRSEVFVNESGDYFLTLSDRKTGCLTKAPAVRVAHKSIKTPSIDPLPSLCAAAGNDILLRGVPTGGIFSGKGITDNSFNPVLAGVGIHEIRYTTSSENCPIHVSQVVEVIKPFTLQMPKSLQLSPGASVRIAAEASVEVSAQWEPTEGLSSATSLQPLATPDQSITYKLTALSDNGCRMMDSVRIHIGKRMFIPSAFSPNNDGQNDTWEIKNTHLFPDCEVTVFNRWGQPIYFSKGSYNPWNGTMQDGAPVPNGVYAYQIKLNDGSDFAYTGKVNIIY